MAGNIGIGILTEKGTKSKIIDALSEHGSLTAKELHNVLRKQYSSTNSYQATHKTLQQLLEEQVITKNAEGYSISHSWLENQQKYLKELAKKNQENRAEKSLATLKEGESLNLTFRGIPDLGWLLIDKVMKASNPEKKHGLALWKF